MRFVPLGVPGAFLVEVSPRSDSSGAFAGTSGARGLDSRDLATEMAQTRRSRAARRGTLRGLHWQAEPHATAKLVRCVRGRVYDVVVDVRRDSHAFRQHVAVELSADSGTAVYVPAGAAHGFLSLADDCEVHVAAPSLEALEAARGARFDDPAFGIVWPEPVAEVSPRDLAWPTFGV